MGYVLLGVLAGLYMEHVSKSNLKSSKSTLGTGFFSDVTEDRFDPTVSGCGVRWMQQIKNGWGALRDPFDKKIPSQVEPELQRPGASTDYAILVARLDFRRGGPASPETQRHRQSQRERQRKQVHLERQRQTDLATQISNVDSATCSSMSPCDGCRSLATRVRCHPLARWLYLGTSSEAADVFRN